MMKTNYRSRLLMLSAFFGWMACMIVGLQAQTATDDPESFSRTYSWKYAGETYEATLSLNWDAYNFYKEQPRIYGSYAIYTYENPRHRYLAEVAKVLQRKARARRLNNWQTLELVIAFVQQLDYVRDVGEYPKFPIETLAEKGGDCEDTSLLLAGLLRQLGYDAILINPPGHMGIALACSDCEGTAYHRNGRRYYYVETTGPGFDIGEIPPEYEATRDKIYALEAPLEGLWLMSMGSNRDRGEANYYVQEDGATSQTCEKAGDCVTTTRQVRSVLVDGETFTTTSVIRWARE